MQVKSIAECSKGSILQYFRLSFSYHLSLRSLFYLFLSGRFRQVLLYIDNKMGSFNPDIVKFNVSSINDFVKLTNLFITEPRLNLL